MEKGLHEVLNQKLTRLTALFREAMKGGLDALTLNRIAFQAGELELGAKRIAADLEAGRKPLHFEIRDELIEKGTSKTAAEQEARVDPRYLNYVQRIKTAQQVADDAALLHKSAYQRAWMTADAEKAERALSARKAGAEEWGEQAEAVEAGS